ncbi:hypothetical protein JCM16358_14710 [Halanaerocella petrolearia]
MLKKEDNFLEVAQESSIIGIGISLTFMFSFQGLVTNIKVWGAYILFGGIVGFFIGLANTSLDKIFNKLPDSSLYIILKLIIVYTVSDITFYLVGLIFFTLLSISTDYLLYTSLAVGIPSVMINLFYTFMAEKETKLQLEKENKKLAVIEERNRIARELHDSVSQNLFGISLNLNTLEHLIAENPEKSQEITYQLQEMVQEIQTEMRLMIYELKPLTFQERDFFAAIENLANLFQKRYNLDINLKTSGDENHLTRKEKLNIYRIIQEILNNIIQHAQANQVQINLIATNNLELTITDDGVGFNPEQISTNNQFGIKGMKERVKQINGHLNIDSTLEKGTTIELKIDNLKN